MNEILKAKNLHKNYNSGRKILEVIRGIDFTVHKGDMIFVIGPSGAGKSTLLHLLAGLDRPDKGEVIFSGRNIYKLSDKELSAMRNSNIRFVFQFYHLLGEFSAVENVMLPGLISGLEKPNVVKARAGEILSMVGLSGRADSRVQELSGGEQQRVAIARALINNPDILFCDEPTGNLDSQNSNDIFNLLFTLNSRDKVTTIVVTHQKDAAKRSPNIFGIKDGLLKNNMV